MAYSPICLQNTPRFYGEPMEGLALYFQRTGSISTVFLPSLSMRLFS